VQNELRDFLDYLRLNRNTSAHTVAAYGSDLSQFVAFAAGHFERPSARLRPADLDLSVIRAFLAELYRQGQSRASAARKLSALRSFVRFLRREGLIQTDPAALVMSPKREQKVPAHLSIDEMSRLLEAPDASGPLGRRDRAILELFYASGLRLSELVGLDVEDVNLSARIVRVSGKGGKERLVPFNTTTQKALRRWYADRAQLLNLKAQLADKEAQLILAQQQFKRESNLMKAKATSEGAYESAEAALRSATAQVAALKAQIQNTESVLKGDETNLGFTKILAPMSGTVASQIAKQGQTLNASQQAPIVMRIADLSVMTVWTQVSEADIGRLRIGMDAYFTTLGQPDRRWYGKLRKIQPTPEIINNVVLYNALFDVPNPTGELLTQMSAQVFFVTAGAKDALLVPMAALKPLEGRAGKKGKNRTDDDGARTEKEKPAQPVDLPKPRRYKVEVLNAEGQPEDRVVTVGITNRVSAQILSGLAEGERVVIGAPRSGKSSKENRPARPPRLS